MKRSFFFSIAIIILSLSIAYSAPISKEKAEKVAINWAQQNAISKLPAADRQKLIGKGQIVKSLKQIELKKQDTIVGHVINLDPKGFVLVAPDDLMRPILAYSLTETFNEKNLPPAVQDWLSEISDINEWLKKNPQAKAGLKTISEWDKLSIETDTFIKKAIADPQILATPNPVLLPLTTDWNQPYPYSAHCPPLLNIEEGFSNGQYDPGFWSTEHFNFYSYSYPTTGSNWFRTGIWPFDREARSGAIGDNETTCLETYVYLHGPGSVTFMREVSSEADADFLSFEIDFIEVESWSGEVANSWVPYCYVVWEPGLHVFTWKYTKNSSGNAGGDYAIVDNIQISPISPKAGCVAVAMGQIMKYHQHPSGYDWANMPDSITESSPQIEIGCYRHIAC